jgi:hypothetical protein
MRELATAMNCDPSYITAMIDDLERAGLATRRPSTQIAVSRPSCLPAVGMRRCALRDGLLAPPPQLAQLTKAEQQSSLGCFSKASISRAAPDSTVKERRG